MLTYAGVDKCVSSLGIGYLRNYQYLVDIYFDVCFEGEEHRQSTEGDRL